MSTDPAILAIGTAVPSRRYSQEELTTMFGVNNPKIQRLFRNSHIKYRHLILPEPGPYGMPDESIEELNAKHKKGCLEVGGQAIARALEEAGLGCQDIDYLICVTTTGYLCPGISAFLIRDLGFRPDVGRIDIVGMGCNAALNGLQPAANFAAANPGKNVLILCVEICSAAYVHNDSMVTAVVNSLFGDAAAAVVLRAQEAQTGRPRVLGFESITLTDAIHTMRFDLDNGKLSFYLDRDIPYVIGANCGRPVGRLLERFGLKRRHIQHWLVHSGGKKVIDSVKMNLDLTDYDVRHTLYVLENYGNISSCACLFSFRRLLDEGVVRPGDYGVLMAMGPGAAIETALLQW
ncbi:MAG TPA: 3,5-dihydroxyphenylacetyl-CoA synthase DpgA [Candidatus Nitrosotenuis sp.]|nr:3,5-dihydroxyphenylacetyl-CoA synthase DpgA [Candidatus Nitrosotenuis sp.]